MKNIEVKIDQLILDQMNPRIEEQGSQKDALQSVLDDQGSKLGELASDISLHGLSPIDRFLLISDGNGNFISLEGNRRTAALLILNNPEIIKDIEIPDALRGKLIKAADEFESSLVEPISAVIVDKREDARRWLKLRHTGENGGRGIVNWNGVQTARFADSKMKPIIDFINEAVSDSAPVIDAKFPITSLERLLENPEVRKKLGLEISDGRFRSKTEATEIAKPLLRMAKDLATKLIKVDDIKTKAQQKEYLDGFLEEDLPAAGAGIAPTDFDKLSAQLPKKPAPIPPPPPPPPAPKPRSRLIPSNFKAPIYHNKLSAIASDLKRLSVKSYPIPVAVCLRVFIEGTIDIYMETFSLPMHKTGSGAGLKLREKISAVNEHLKAEFPKHKKLANAANAKLTNAQSVISTTRLHDFVHNTELFPSINELLTAWDSIEAWINQVWHIIDEKQ